MKLFIIGFILASPSCLASESFCGAAPDVSLVELVSPKNVHVNQRVRTEGLLKTDGKEWTLITPAEDSKRGLRLGFDDESFRYRESHGVPTASRDAILGDFTEKLRSEGGGGVTLDRARIADYRQKLRLCGRVVRTGDRYEFVLDDSVLEDSYFMRSH